MDDILTQRFSYCNITAFKNYSHISDKNSSISSISSNLDDFHGEGFTIDDFLRMDNKKMKGKIISFPEKRGNRKTHFFYGNSDIEERFNLNYAIRNFDTTKERHIKKHYSNPFADVRVEIVERSVRRNGDKITIKLYRKIKHRYFNAIYFKSTTTVTSITINTVTGNFIILNHNKYGKTNTKTFRTNSFANLNEICREGQLFGIKSYINKESKLFSDYCEIFNDNTFLECINTVFGFDTTISSRGENFKNNLVKRFVTLRKIKVPDNYYNLLTTLYPTEKYLKKNDRKLIVSILDMFNIKTKITIKLLHKYPELDITALIKLCNYLGENYSKYIGSVNSDIFEKCVTPSKYTITSNLKSTLMNNKPHDFLIKDIEKENMVKILNDRTMVSKDLNRLFDEFYDHFNMINKLREFIPEIYLKSKTYIEFHNEHLELSKMISFIRKGWVIEYKFDDTMVQEIEKPIKIFNSIDIGGGLMGTDMNDYVLFYPHILKREEEYDEEGKFMHHCVASYSNKDVSIIISLRTEDMLDRVTCEFNCTSGDLQQARHFCNGEPPEKMKRAIENLKPIVSKFARMKLLKSIEKNKVPVKINGVEVTLENVKTVENGAFFNMF
jgi:hypothetical protein